MSTKQKKTKGLPNSVDVHVGNRLRIRRSLLGLSQEKLAKAIGLTFQQIQKYEKGLNRISAGRLYQFSQLLEVPVSYFFENIEKNNGLNSPNELESIAQEIGITERILHQKETIDLIRAYYSIENEQLRKDVLSHLKALAKLSQKAG